MNRINNNKFDFFLKRKFEWMGILKNTIIYWAVLLQVTK